MSDPRLERIRQLMREEEEKKNGNNKPSSFGGDNASYAFWNIPENTVATLRFLPDKDDTNPWFWVERQVIRLTFNGTINGDSPTDKAVTVTVPCVDMFGDVCPIIAETKPWWKDESKIEDARKYYKKRSFIAQGFVVNSPFEEPNKPENPIRRFSLGKELIDKLKAGMADTEMEYLPTDFQNGTDFKIRKTKKGGKESHNSYATSEWSRRSRPLSEAEVIALEQHGLFNLADFRWGTRPTQDHIAAIKAMFHASLNDQPYDFAEFGKYFRPYGVSGGTPATGEDDVVDEVSHDTSSVKVESAPAVEHTTVKADLNTKPQPQDILAKLRERTASRT
jgi:hypothetical protein